MLSWLRREQHEKPADVNNKSTAGTAPPEAGETEPGRVGDDDGQAKGNTTATSVTSQVVKQDVPPVGPIPDVWEPKRPPKGPVRAETQESNVRRADHKPFTRLEASTSAHVLPPTAIQSLETLPTVASDAQVSGLNRLYDPFNGTLLGVFSTPPSAPANNQAREELWSHLSTIRALQSEIAAMHVAMEGVGLNEKAAQMRARFGRARTRSGSLGEPLDLSGSDAEYNADGNDVDKEEARLRRERDREFELAERRFDGRKESVEKIMAKLGELSRALATFHALETPVVDLGTRPDAASLNLSGSPAPTFGSASSPLAGPSSYPPFLPTLSPRDYSVQHGEGDYFAGGTTSKSHTMNSATQSLGRDR